MPWFRNFFPVPKGNSYNPLMVTRSGRALLLGYHVGTGSNSLLKTVLSHALSHDQDTFKLRPCDRRRLKSTCRALIRFLPSGSSASLSPFICGYGLSSCSAWMVELV